MSQPDQLAHTLKTRHVSMIALGGAVGAGFFIGAAAAIQKAGPVVFLSYGVAGLLIFLINRSMAELALSRPNGGSFMMQIREVLGGRAGFIAGWAYWLTWVIVLGAEVMAGAAMLAPYVPLPFAVIEGLLLLVMTGVNLLSVRGYGEFEYWFSLVKLVAIGGFIAICVAVLSAGFAGWRAPVPVWHTLSGFGGLHPKGWAAVLAVIPTIVFSMTGSEIVTVAAVESADPDGNIVRSTRSLAIRIGVFYLASIALILCFQPWASMVPTRSPFLAVLDGIGVKYAGAFVWGVILTAVLSTLNSAIYVTSRILYEMAENEDAPAFFLPVDARTKLPRRAVLASAGAALVVILTTFLSRDGMFAFLLSLTGTLMLFNNLLIILARLKTAGGASGGAGLACVLLALTLTAMIWVPETRSQFLYGAAAVIIISLAASLRYRKRRAAKGRTSRP